jgi:hypothetical protein
MANSKQIATGNFGDFLPNFVIFAHFMTNSQIMAPVSCAIAGASPYPLAGYLARSAVG